MHILHHQVYSITCNNIQHGCRLEHQTALAKVQVALQNSSLSPPSNYAFLTNFTYTLGEDNLTHFGQQELVNSGLKFFDRYGALGNASAPFVRASGSARVIESAQNFTQGFNAAASNRSATTRLVPANSILVIPEADTSNDTLKVETAMPLRMMPLSILSATTRTRSGPTFLRLR